MLYCEDEIKIHFVTGYGGYTKKINNHVLDNNLGAHD